jgi:hypothetical protein
LFELEIPRSFIGHALALTLALGLLGLCFGIKVKQDALFVDVAPFGVLSAEPQHKQSPPQQRILFVNSRTTDQPNSLS